MIQEKPLLDDLPTTLRFWVDLLSLLGGAVGAMAAIVFWAIRQSLVTKKELADTVGPMGEDMDSQSARIAALEGEVKHMPTGPEMADLRERMTRIEGVAGNIQTQVVGIHELLERIERPLNVLIDGKLKASNA